MNQEEIVKNAIDWSANELNTIPKIMRQQAMLDEKYRNGELPKKLYDWISDELNDIMIDLKYMSFGYFCGSNRVPKRKLESVSENYSNKKISKDT